MTQLHKFAVVGLFAIAMLPGIRLQAQVGDPATLIKEKLVLEIKLTKATDAHDDIVTAGDVLVLHKDGLMACSSASSYAFSNTYQNVVLAGNLNIRAKDAAKGFLRGHLPFGGGSASDAANNVRSSRKFVAGEKFWVTDIEIAMDNSGISVSTFSDAYNNVRHYSEIKFPFPDKHSVPPVDREVKTVEEVLTVAPGDDSGNNGDSGATVPVKPRMGPRRRAAPAAPAATAAAITPIAPPPPPSDQPPPPTKTIANGQTLIRSWPPGVSLQRTSSSEQRYLRLPRYESDVCRRQGIRCRVVQECNCQPIPQVRKDGESDESAWRQISPFLGGGGAVHV